MNVPADLCDVEVTDAEWAYARQKYIFGGEPSCPFEAGLFALFDLNHEAAS